MCRENLIIKENSSLSSHGLKPRGFSRSFLYKGRCGLPNNRPFKCIKNDKFVIQFRLIEDM